VGGGLTGRITPQVTGCLPIDGAPEMISDLRSFDLWLTSVAKLGRCYSIWPVLSGCMAAITRRSPTPTCQLQLEDHRKTDTCWTDLRDIMTPCIMG
jgi:hypothetical protein